MSLRKELASRDLTEVTNSKPPFPSSGSLDLNRARQYAEANASKLAHARSQTGKTVPRDHYGRSRWSNPRSAHKHGY